MPYRDVKASDLILRDLLARDRTVLANERTLLAYVRTALMLVISGVTLYKLMPDGGTAVALTSGAGIGAGLAVVAWGWRSYVRVKRRLALLGGDESVAPRAADAFDAGRGEP